jgi:hypothetical protein
MNLAVTSDGEDTNLELAGTKEKTLPVPRGAKLGETTAAAAIWSMRDRWGWSEPRDRNFSDN